MCKSVTNVLHRADHEVTRKADSNVFEYYHQYFRHRFHLVPLPFPLLGLPEGALVTYILAFVRTAAAAALLGECIPTCSYV